jgi:predicted nucleic acid-binding protein
MVERVYLDTNVYYRPLDSQTSRRVKSESRAFMEIVNIALHGDIVIVSSDYIRFEIKQIHGSLKRKDVRGFERALSSVNVASNKSVIALAKEISSKCSLNSLDALHLSAACFGNADYFLTCDDEILTEKSRIAKLSVGKGYRLKVRNPVNYIEERQR